MSRSKWKGKFVQRSILKKVNNFNIWSRNSTITANFIGKTVQVYTGKEFKKIFITRSKIGYKFGHFIFTRKYTQKYKVIKNLKKKK